MKLNGHLPWLYFRKTLSRNLVINMNNKPNSTIIQYSNGSWFEKVWEMENLDWKFKLHMVTWFRFISPFSPSGSRISALLDGIVDAFFLLTEFYNLILHCLWLHRKKVREKRRKETEEWQTHQRFHYNTFSQQGERQRAPYWLAPGAICHCCHP